MLLLLLILDFSCSNTVDVQAEVQEESSPEVTEAPKPPVLEISANTHNFKVYIEGEEILDPFDLPPGNHFLQITAPGYYDLFKSVSMKKNETTTLVLDFKPWGDGIDVNSLARMQILGYVNKDDSYEVLIKDEIKHIPVENIVLDFIETDKYIIGLKKAFKYEPSMFAGVDLVPVAIDRLVVINKETQKVQEREYNKSNMHLQFKLEENILFVDANAGVYMDMNRFKYMYNLESIDLNKPQFYYASNLGAEGEPLLGLDSIEFTSEKVTLNYKYYEVMGFPDLGIADIEISYKIDNGNYSLTSFDFNGTCDRDSIRNNTYSPRDIFTPGQNYIIENNTFKLSFEDFNKRFNFREVESLVYP